MLYERRATGPKPVPAASPVGGAILPLLAVATHRPLPMNFKLLALGTLALALPLAYQAVAVPASAAPVSAAAPWKVDSGHSSVVFRVKHIVAPFWGRFDKVSGTVQWDAAKPETASVELAVDVGSVNTNDDLDALRRLSGESALPFGTIGRQQLKGFSDAEWTQYLDAAGYPAQSRLPKGYTQPAATPLAPAKAPAASAPDAPQEAASAPTGRLRRQAPPPPPPGAPTPSNPAGIRF